MEQFILDNMKLYDKSNNILRYVNVDGVQKEIKGFKANGVIYDIAYDYLYIESQAITSISYGQPQGVEIEIARVKSSVSPLFIESFLYGNSSIDLTPVPPTTDTYRVWYDYRGTAPNTTVVVSAKLSNNTSPPLTISFGIYH